MNYIKKYTLLFITLTILTCCISQIRPDKTYYLTHLTVIDVIEGKTLRDITVAISDSIISAVGSASEINIPGNAKVINCNGKYILPGLWDMHVHLGNATISALPLFIANGITGVRDMGSRRFDTIQKWREQISSGQLTGPRIISPGSILNGGHPDQDFQIGINTEEEARRVVDSLAGIGVDFIKVHASLTRETYYAIAKEAAKLHIPFAGHVPASNSAVIITGEEASEAGQKSLEHMLGIPFARDTIKIYQHMYPTQESLNHLFAVLLKNGTYITPTLSVYQIPADYLAISAKLDTLIKYISPELKSFWDTQIVDWPERNKSFMNWLLKARMNMIPALRDAGIPLLSGTDTGFPFILPGFGLHEELKYLVAAGLSPLEAIQTATINPATFLGKAGKSGSVEKGKLADLIILNADPTQNIQNLHFIEAVIMNGRLYDRSALDNELKQVAEQVKLFRPGNN
ncbi:MAG TPA: amidohydrolase family protein [Cyclobacteriaceae bacterium]|nr:amidohydrolase family protein [Cyclobacteriaceae bacterium]